jgi:hypothetical protein
MISLHGPTAVNGTYNVMGTRDGAFILQGNLTVDELKELKAEINTVLKGVKK